MPEAPAGEHVEGGRFLGHHHGVAVVVGQHQAADPQRRGGVGGGHQARDGREGVVEVVGDREGGPAEVLHLAGNGAPAGSVG